MALIDTLSGRKARQGYVYAFAGVHNEKVHPDGRCRIAARTRTSPVIASLLHVLRGSEDSTLVHSREPCTSCFGASVTYLNGVRCACSYENHCNVESPAKAPTLTAPNITVTTSEHCVLYRGLHATLFVFRPVVPYTRLELSPSFLDGRR